MVLVDEADGAVMQANSRFLLQVLTCILTGTN